MPLCSGVSHSILVNSKLKYIQTQSQDSMQWSIGVSNITYTNTNRTATATVTSEKTVLSNRPKSTGKWYTEINLTGSPFTDQFLGVAGNNTTFPGNTGSNGFGIRNSGQYFTSIGGQTSGASATYVAEDICQLAIDFDAKKLWFGKNGTWHNSGDPANGTNAIFINWNGSPTLYLAVRLYYSSNSVTIVSPLIYAVPSGFQIW